MPEPAPPEPPAHLETTAITSGRRFSADSLAPVLFPSTTYEVETLADHLDRGNTARPPHYYSRFGSPTVRELEDAVAELEGAEAGLAAGSGMGTIAAVVLGLCSTGDHVVASRQVFSVTYGLLAFHLPRFGIDVTFVDGTDADAIAAAVQPGRTQVVLVETPANPSMSLVDLDALGALAGPITVVDSTFAGPLVQRPLDHGVDLVVHAATKGLAGHNDALLGVVAGSAELIDAVWAWQSVMGAQASPFDAWNGIRGIRTLAVRTRQQCDTALAPGPLPRGPPGRGAGPLPVPGQPPPARAGPAPDAPGRHRALAGGRRRRGGCPGLRGVVPPGPDRALPRAGPRRCSPTRPPSPPGWCPPSGS
jgi:cystathionine beta-lyase/cystathionine gamma-synthase